MFQEKTTLKLLPCGAKKSLIFKMYPRESEKSLRELIQAIQIEVRTYLTPEKARLRQTLNRREIEKIIEHMGTPRGYQNKFND